MCDEDKQRLSAEIERLVNEAIARFEARLKTNDLRAKQALSAGTLISERLLEAEERIFDLEREQFERKQAS